MYINIYSSKRQDLKQGHNIVKMTLITVSVSQPMNYWDLQKKGS